MDVNGLVYPSNFLDNLPVLPASPSTTTSAPPPNTIRKLSAAQFAELHLQHTLAHPPDNVLFPFLHGLEGDNHAQNTFFASSSFASASGTSYRSASNHVHPNARITPKVPNYRGLVWVVCEDDLEQAGDDISLRILRRKPLQENGLQGVAPTPSSSSEGSDSGETEEGEDDGEYSESSDFHDDLDEEEQDMLIMIQAETSEAEAEARRHGFNPHDAGSGIGIVDDSDSDGGASPLLASPVDYHPLPLNDHVRVVCAGADEEEGGVVVVSPEKENHDKLEKDEQHYEGKHMHPVAHRPPISTTPVAAPVSAPVPVPFNPHGLGITTSLDKSSMTPASISSTFTSSSISSPSSPSSTFTTPLSTPSSSSSEEPSLSPTPAFPDDVKPPQQQPRLTSNFSANTVTQVSFPPSNNSQQRSSKPVLKHPTNPSAPPLLTSTFRPKELVRRTKRIVVQQGNEVKVLSGQEGEREDEGSWEFVPAKVPNGISLRNFGIQVVSFFFFLFLVVFFFSFVLFSFSFSLFFFFFFFLFFGCGDGGLHGPSDFMLSEKPREQMFSSRFHWTDTQLIVLPSLVACSFFAFCFHSFSLPAVLLSTFFFLSLAYACKLLCFFYASVHFCSAPMHSGLSVVFFASLWCSIESGRWGLKQRGSTLFFAIFFFSFVRSPIRSRRLHKFVLSPIVTWSRHWAWTRAL